MRDINERNRARGVADFWNDRTTMDVVTGARFSLPYTETQWIVAVRRLLGYGYSGIGGCTNDTATCSCHRYHQQDAVNMDPAAHFHFNSCPLAAGHRTNRHDSLDPILRHLCGFAKTCGTPRHDCQLRQRTSVKIMDATTTPQPLRRLQHSRLVGPVASPHPEAWRSKIRSGFSVQPPALRP